MRSLLANKQFFLDFYNTEAWKSKRTVIIQFVFEFCAK